MTRVMPPPLSWRAVAGRHPECWAVLLGTRGPAGRCAGPRPPVVGVGGQLVPKDTEAVLRVVWQVVGVGGHHEEEK